MIVSVAVGGVEWVWNGLSFIGISRMQDVMKYRIIWFSKRCNHRVSQYHRNGQLLRNISSQLNYTKSTVAWFRSERLVGIYLQTADPRNWKIEIEEYCLEKFGRTKPINGIHTPRVSTGAGYVVSINAILKEAPLLEFYSHATVYKSLTTKPKYYVKIVQSISPVDRTKLEMGSLARKIKVYPLANGW